MAEAFKNVYNEQLFDKFTKDLKRVIDDFDAHEFVSRKTFFSHSNNKKIPPRTSPGSSNNQRK